MGQQTDIGSAIRELNASAKRAFGKDMCVLVARAAAFGNDDTCILIHGRRHVEAAAGLATKFPGSRVRTESGRCSIDDSVYTHSVVEVGGAA